MRNSPAALTLLILLFVGLLAAGVWLTAPAAAANPHGRPASAAGIDDPGAMITPAALPLQPVGVNFTDPAFNTTLRRVSNASDSGGFETQIYSQLQAFSADNAYLLLTGDNGYVIRRVSDLAPIAGPLDLNIPRWHPTQAHTLIHFDSNADMTVRVQFTNVDTASTNTVFTFPSQYQRARVNQSFDEISEDGRWLAGEVTRNDGGLVIFALDLQNLRLGAVLPVHDLYTGPCQPDPDWGEVEPDWIAPSPLGRYLLVQWTRDGTTRCSGLEAFDIQTGAFAGRVYDDAQHGDLGVMPDGTTEFFMTFEIYAPCGPGTAIRFLPGNATVAPPTCLQSIEWGNMDHISCRGPHGLCVVTASWWTDNGWNPFEQEIFIQYTDGRVRRLAHHRSSECGYWVQPRASVSRDGRYIVFASDWGRQINCGDLGRGDPYIIDLGTDGTPTPTPTPNGTPTQTPTATPTSAFDCNRTPDAPVLSEPLHNSTTSKRRPILKWNAANCAETYAIVVKNAATGDKVHKQTGLTALQSKTTRLTLGVTYKWFVRACRKNFGCTKSAVWKFTVE